MQQNSFEFKLGDTTSALKALIENDLIADLSNISSYLYHAMENINWLGFYLVKGETLVVGPFQGKPACVKIPFGKGVCGHVAQTLKPILVRDVEDFLGHIACDAASRSEMVLPILVENKLVAVLDVDSPHLNRFTENDLKIMEEVVCEVLVKLKWK